MKKSKLLSSDGSEFTVFYLKAGQKQEVEKETSKMPDGYSVDQGGAYHDPDHPLNKHDEGQTYWMSSEKDPALAPELNELNEQDVNENSAGGGAHAYWYDGTKFFTELEGDLSNVKDILKKDLENYLEQKKLPSKNIELNKIFAVNHPIIDDEPILDDTIESDIVREPIVNELYRVRGLNKITRFKAHSQVEGVFTKRYFHMSHHGQEFHVINNALVNAKNIEKSHYLGKPF